MTPDPIDRVFGRARLKMVTGEHVEVFREAAAPGESRRYTKRFLTTAAGDYAQWTEREWRILARLIGHGTRCVPDVVQYDRDVHGTKLVQTYDAGATVDQWATLLPVERDGRLYAHAFDDCAHWWALAHHCLVALDEIHTLQLVHLDVKGDNICIPIGPPNFDPAASAQLMFPIFSKLALIDFAFSLVSGESLTTPLPIGWQRDYDYQSPRLLHALEAGRAGDLQPTEDLDWRCDMYSLAAMLKRYLPSEHRLYDLELASGWTPERHDAAKRLIVRIRETHDRDLTSRRPHGELIAQTSEQLGATDLAQSLDRGWTLAREAQSAAAPVLPLTPITRLAPPIRIVIPARDDLVAIRRRADASGRGSTVSRGDKVRSKLPLLAAAVKVAVMVGVLALFAAPDTVMTYAAQRVVDGSRGIGEALRQWVKTGVMHENDASQAQAGESQSTPPGIAPARTDAADDVAVAPIPAEKSARDANSVLLARDPSREANVAAMEGSIVPWQPESPETLSPAEPSLTSVLPAGRDRPASAASSQALLTGSSLANQIEAYRSKQTQRSTSVAGATPPATPSSGRAPNARPVDSTRGRHVARTHKVPRAATSVATVAPRAPALASKRASGVSVAVSSRVPAAASPARGVQSTAPTAKAQVGAAMAAKDIAAAAGVAGQGAATHSPPAQTAAVVSAPSQTTADVRVTAAPPSTVAAVTFPISPPVETPRAATVPSTVDSSSGVAPIVDASRPLVAPAIPAPREPSPPPELEPTRKRSAPFEIHDDAHYLENAQWMLANVVPRMSARGQLQIARVLWVAANARHPAQEREVIYAATSARVVPDAAAAAREIAPREARRLHEESRRAYWSRRHVPEAFAFELKAFGANPTDPEIAGNLAFLHLQVVPAQPERARQLAVYAIGMQNAQYPTGRMDDWTTFAIASALTGRQVEARYALFAALALSRNVDRSCRTALGALATFGNRLREPVEALLLRLHAQGRADDSPYCVWLQNDFAGSSRYP